MRNGSARKVIFFAALLALWAIVTKLGIWERTLFPSPWRVAEALWHSIQDRSLLIATGVSLRRVLTGYALSLAIGVPLGVLLARVRWLEETLGSLVLGMQALPSIGGLPLARRWLVLNDSATPFAVAIGAPMA